MSWNEVGVLQQVSLAWYVFVLGALRMVEGWNEFCEGEEKDGD